MFNQFYDGKRVLLTGHTGFKGSWMSEWLIDLGAEVYGYSLEPPTDPSLFEQLKLNGRVNHLIADIRDLKLLKERIAQVNPDLVFHCAAQTLVRLSYVRPVETFTTNVMGSVHVLEALRDYDRKCGVVIITTDKCYENREWEFGYRENDPMGGHDPYSTSKGCAELAVQSYRRSFFSETNLIKIASARAGNVIGGGDWADDRIVPDVMRALSNNKTIKVRNPDATRPWQHVLDPLCGYLLMGMKLYKGDNKAASAFNFGPHLDSNRSVEELVNYILKYWPGKWENMSGSDNKHEASLLHLQIDKAWHYLNWRPIWDFDKTIEKTVEWYRGVLEKRTDPYDITIQQIKEYMEDAKRQGVDWAE